MRLNYETCLVGKKSILVPYRPQHIAKYHDWMQDPHLLEMTGSEPLSYEEEVEMQQSWRDDDEKCTFIVLDKEVCVGLPPVVAEDGDNTDGTSDVDDEVAQGALPEKFVEMNLHAMVGDVNLFLSEEKDDETDGDEDKDDEENVTNTRISSGPISSKSEDTSCMRRRQAELDIMIAEPTARGKGLGSEASRVMMRYGAQNLDVRRFFAKIKKENNASRSLFTSKLGFVECNFVKCFGEYEYEFRKESATDMVDTLQKELGFEVLEWKSKLSSDKPNLKEDKN